MSAYRIADLSRCREHIDEIDEKLVQLINQRTRIVEEIGRIKQQLELAVYEPKREEQVFQHISRSNEGPLSDDALKRIFERIIDEMRTVQKTRMQEEKC